MTRIAMRTDRRCDKEWTMAAKKNSPPSPTTNGEPAAASAEKEPKPRRVNKAQRRRRIQALQERAARLRAMLDEIQGDWVGWHHLVGSHADAPEAFEEAMRLGREWRESFRPKPGRRKARPVDDHS
jgi:hypothetical protein